MVEDYKEYWHDVYILASTKSRQDEMSWIEAWKGARLTKSSSELQQESGVEDEIIERRVLFFCL